MDGCNTIRNGGHEMRKLVPLACSYPAQRMAGRRLRVLGLGCLALLVGCGGDDASLRGDPRCRLSAADEAMLAAVNQARSSPRACGGSRYPAAPALRWNCALATAAQRHSSDMAQHGIFSHTGSDGLSVAERATNAGYAWRAIGENIARGYSDVDAVMQGWLGSSEHCANIMSAAFADLGAAAASHPNTSSQPYWTQVFGRQR